MAGMHGRPAWALPSRVVLEPRRAGLAIALGVIAAAFVLLGDAPSTLTGVGTDQAILAGSTAGLAVVVGMAIVDPLFGLATWMVAMPILNLARIQMQAGSVAVTASTVVIGALGIGLLLDARRGGAPYRRSRFGDPTTRLTAAGALVIGALVIVSALVNAGGVSGAGVVLHGVLEPLAVTLIVVAIQPGVSGIARLLVALATSVTVASVLALYRLSHVARTVVEAQAARGDFGHFLYYNVNIFGEVLALGLPIAIAALLVVVRRSQRPVVMATIAASVLLFVSLYFTFSKGAWLGSLAGVGLIAFVVARGRLQHLGVAVAVTLATLLIVPVPVYIVGMLPSGAPAPSPQPGASQLPSPTSGNGGLIGAYNSVLETVQGANRVSSWDPSTATGEVSVHERLLAWRAAAAMAISSPVLGVGAGQFGPQEAGPFRQAGATRDLNSAHNYLLNIGAELGLVVLALVLVAIATVIIRTWRTYRSGDPLARFVSLAIVGAMTAFLVVGETTGADLYAAYRVMNSDGILFAVLVGAGLALSVRAPLTTRQGSG